MKKLIAIIVLLVGLTYGWHQQHKDFNASTVANKVLEPTKVTMLTYQEPTQKTFVPKQFLTSGQIIRGKSIAVPALHNGILWNMKLENGLQVKKGETLAYIDNNYYGRQPITAQQSGTIENVTVLDGKYISANYKIAEISDMQADLLSVSLKAPINMKRFKAYVGGLELTEATTGASGKNLSFNVANLQLNDSTKVQVKFVEKPQSPKMTYTEVPMHALRISGSNWYCGVLDNGKLAFKKVKLAGFNQGRAQIASGLEEQTQIVLYSSQMKAGTLIN